MSWELAVLGCKFPLRLDGLPCPCTAGYTCDSEGRLERFAAVAGGAPPRRRRRSWAAQRFRYIEVTTDPSYPTRWRFVAAANGQRVVANRDPAAINVFAVGADGNTAPIRQITVITSLTGSGPFELRCPEARSTSESAAISRCPVRCRSPRRGDHVFANGLVKLPGELRDLATAVELIGSKQAVNSAISLIRGKVSNAAFELTVDKKDASGKEGDPQSQAFGNALQAIRPNFRRFFEDVAMLDLALATGATSAETAAAVTTARAALTALGPQWTQLIDAVHDPGCSAFLDSADKKLEQQGLAILSDLKTSFPQALGAAVSTASASSTPPPRGTNPPGTGSADPKANGP